MDDRVGANDHARIAESESAHSHAAPSEAVRGFGAMRRHDLSASQLHLLLCDIPEAGFSAKAVARFAQRRLEEICRSESGELTVAEFIKAEQFSRRVK